MGVLTHFRISFTALFVMFLLASCGEKKVNSPAINMLNTKLLSKELMDSVYKYIQKVPNNTQIAIALIKNGQEQFYGIQRSLDTLKSTRNGNKVFEIGSLTKVFTSTILSNFVVEGKLSLDDTINGIFPFPFHNNTSFTYKSLANHTSGLPRLPSNLMMSAIFNPGNPYESYDEKKFESYLREDLKLEYEPKTKCEYSNLGMGLLANALTRFSGKTFESLLKEKIFSKYNMEKSSTIKPLAEDLIQGQNEDGETTPNWSAGSLIGMGGIYSSVKDLSKFVLAQFDTTHQELVLTRIMTFQESKSRAVGLGWFIIQTNKGDQWFWHNGGTGGYTSSMVFDDKKQNGVVILSNLSAYHNLFKNIDQLAFSLMETIK